MILLLIAVLLAYLEYLAIEVVAWLIFSVLILWLLKIFFIVVVILLAMAFGGVWDAWKDPSNEDWLQSFSIITTDPNELTATVHDRMPVILKPTDYDRWLDRVDAERPQVDLLRPYEAAEMTARPVDPCVGSVRNNEPGLCAPWECPPNSQ